MAAQKNNSDKTGMLVARVMLWTVGMYAMAMIFGSMLLQLYGPPPRVEPAPPGSPTPYAHRWCLGTLARLHVELQEMASHSIEKLDADAKAWDSWKPGWDERHQRAALTCSASLDANLATGFQTEAAIAAHYSEAIKKLTTDSVRLRNTILDTVQGAAFSD